jgi:hypothetical protein
MVSAGELTDAASIAAYALCAMRELPDRQRSLPVPTNVPHGPATGLEEDTWTGTTWWSSAAEPPA